MQQRNIRNLTAIHLWTGGGMASSNALKAKTLALAIAIAVSRQRGSGR
jgi:hypothetical protein